MELVPEELVLQKIRHGADLLEALGRAEEVPPGNTEKQQAETQLGDEERRPTGRRRNGGGRRSKNGRTWRMSCCEGKGGHQVLIGAPAPSQGKA